MKKRNMNLTVATIALALTLSGCGSSGDNNIPTPITPPAVEEPTIPTVEYVPFDAPILDDGTKHEYLTAINNVRATGRYCGATFYPAVAPLQWNDSLYKASYEHSEDLIMSGTFSHDGSGTDSDWTAQVLELGRGSNMQERGANNGYTDGYIGENIYWLEGRDNTLEVAMNGWLESEGHCANMMRAEHTDFGMARVENMWTEILAYKY